MGVAVVGGAVVGGADVNDVLGEADGEGVEVDVGVAVGLAVGLPVEPVVDAAAFVPAERAETDTDGVNIAGCVDDGELVHAETPAETRTAKVAAPTTAEVFPAAVARTFMEPPCMPGTGTLWLPASGI